MKKKNVVWTEVEAAGTSVTVPNGGYVIKIVDVEDNEEWESLNLIFDIAEGDQQGLFADMDEDDDWRHRLRQGYSDNQERFFKSFLEALEESNRSFSIEKWQDECDEHDFIGLKVGAVISRYHRISNQGNATFDYNAIFMSTDRIRKGDFTVPDDKWSKEALEYEKEEKAEKAKEGGQSSIYDEDVPF